MLANQMTVLVVEDEPIILGLVVVYLRKMGFLPEKIIITENGTEAKKIIEGTRLDLLIADGNFPGGNGPQLMELARELYPHIKLILMSGALQNNLSIYASTLNKLGSFGTLKKPWGLMENFVRAVHEQGVDPTPPPQ